MNKRNWGLVVLGLVLGVIAACGRTPGPTAEPTAVPEPTATPFGAGWKEFKGAGMVMWLPESYKGGDPVKELQVILEDLRALGPGPERMARVIENDPAAFALWAYDTQDVDAAFLTTMNVTGEVVPNVSANGYMNELVQQFPVEFSVVRQETLSLDRYEAVQAEIDILYSEIHSREMLYVLRDGDTLWSVAFATSADDFARRLPDFESSVRTFEARAED